MCCKIKKYNVQLSLFDPRVSFLYWNQCQAFIWFREHIYIYTLAGAKVSWPLLYWCGLWLLLYTAGNDWFVILLNEPVQSDIEPTGCCKTSHLVSYLVQMILTIIWRVISINSEFKHIWLTMMLEWILWCPGNCRQDVINKSNTRILTPYNPTMYVQV